AGQLAVAAEDAAAHVDLVDLGVALAGRDLVVRGVLGRDDADALGGARRDAQRAADALLEARVLEAVELVAAPKAGVDRRLVLGVLERDRALDQAPESGSEAAQRLGGAYRAVGETPRGLRPAPRAPDQAPDGGSEAAARPP